MLKRLWLAVLFLGGSLAVFPASHASALPISTGSASAFAAQLQLGGTDVIPPTPTAATALPPGTDASNTVVDIPASPLAVNGTLIAKTKVHAASDIPSELEVVAQSQAGPYNESAIGTVDHLEILQEVPDAAAIALVNATALRAEAVGVCANGVPKYSANSEIVALSVAGSPIDLNTPVNEILQAVIDALTAAGLAPDLVDVAVNEVTNLPDGGIAVNALHVSVAGAALAEAWIGHAEVGPLTCAPATTTAAPLPECSDNVDNADPEDTVADEDDPGCHTDGNPDNPDTYVPLDDDETDDDLPRTGGPLDTLTLAAGLAGALGLAAWTIRRRSSAI
jgi:hypothetical protein